MTLDEMKDNLDDMFHELHDMRKELEGKDISDLNATHKHFVSQAIKLIGTASSACEEASQYLELD